MRAKFFLGSAAILLLFLMVIDTATLSMAACWKQEMVPLFTDRVLLAVRIICLAGTPVTGLSFLGNFMLFLMTLVAGIFYLSMANVLVWHSGLVIKDNFSDYFSLKTILKIGKQIAWILVIVVALFTLLFWYTLGEDNKTGIGQSKLYTAVYLAVMAFFNSGFSNLPNGLMNEHLQAFYILKFLVFSCALVGSAGIFTLVNLFSVRELRERLKKPEIDWLEYTKVAVFGSALLLLLGSVGFFLLENHHVMHGMKFMEKGIVAYSMAIAPKSSGFTFFNLQTLQPATILLLIVLMVIGGMPGAASGGAGILVVFYAIKHWRIKQLSTRDNSTTGASKTFWTLIVAIAIGILVFHLFSNELDWYAAIFHTVSSICSVGWQWQNGAIMTSATKWLTIFFLITGKFGLPVMLYIYTLRQYRKVGLF